MHDNVYATRVFVNALDHSTISNVKVIGNHVYIQIKVAIITFFEIST